MAGLSIGGLFNFLSATDMGAGQAKLNRQLVKTQRAKNEASAAEAGLARWSQALQNKKLMDKAGDNYNTISENIGRTQDAQGMSRIQSQLAASERLGAATAAFASAGLGGSGTETYKRTMETSQALQTEMQERNFRSSNYLMEQQRGDIIPNAVDSQSRNVINANFDFTNYGPTKGPSLLGSVGTLAVAAGLSAAGAPQAGNFTLNASAGSMQNQYGDGRGATKSFGSALDDLKGGVKELKDTFRFNSGSVGVQSLNLDFQPDPTLSTYLMR